MLPLPKIAGLEKTLEFLFTTLIKITNAQEIIIQTDDTNDIAWYKGNLMDDGTIHVAKTDGFLIELPNNRWIIIQGQDDGVDRQLIRQYCSQVIENAIQYDNIHKQASIDSLTGLPNRVALIEKIDREIKHQTEFSVLFLDVDNFKMINDMYGHSTGDKALRKVALCMGELLREGDFLARYGGDEFVIILHGAECEVVINRLKNKAININEKTLTLSVGMARYPEDGGDVDELIRHADRLMYRDKQKKKYC